MEENITEFDQLVPESPLCRHLCDKRLEWKGLALTSLINPHANAEIECAPFVRDDLGQWRASRWIGSFIVDGRRYRIIPRIGEARFAYIAVSALSAMLVSGAAPVGEIRSDTLLDLLPLAWYVAFKSGRQRNGLPKAYIRREEPDCSELRGSLELGRQLTENHVKRHQIACSWDELTVDNPINRGTWLVIDYLRRNNRFPYSLWHRTEARAELDGWRERLPLMGVRPPSAFPTEHVRWSRSNDGFRPAHRLGFHVIKDQGISVGGASTARSLFIDSAEVWELYLRQRLDAVVKREFPGFEAVWPRNRGDNDALLEWEGRKVRSLIPDFHIAHVRDQKPVVVLDAKYRRFIPLNQDVGVAEQMALYAFTARQGNAGTAHCVLLYPRVAPGDTVSCGLNADFPIGRLGSGKFLVPDSPLIEAWNIDLPDVEDRNPDGFNRAVEAQLKSILDRFIC